MCNTSLQKVSGATGWPQVTNLEKTQMLLEGSGACICHQSRNVGETKLTLGSFFEALLKFMPEIVENYFGEFSEASIWHVGVIGHHVPRH